MWFEHPDLLLAPRYLWRYPINMYRSFYTAMMIALLAATSSGEDRLKQYLNINAPQASTDWTRASARRRRLSGTNCFCEATNISIASRKKQSDGGGG